MKKEEKRVSTDFLSADDLSALAPGSTPPFPDANPIHSPRKSCELKWPYVIGLWLLISLLSSKSDVTSIEMTRRSLNSDDGEVFPQRLQKQEKPGERGTSVPVAHVPPREIHLCLANMTSSLLPSANLNLQKGRWRNPRWGNPFQCPVTFRLAFVQIFLWPH